MGTRKRDGHDPRAAALAGELREVLRKLRRRLLEQTPLGAMSSSQTSVLHRLEKIGPATGSSLARSEGMRPQSMAAVIGALEEAGLVARAPDPSDGRQSLLSLSAAGRRQVQAWRAARQDWLTGTIEARLSTAERKELASALALLRRLTGDG